MILSILNFYKTPKPLLGRTVDRTQKIKALLYFIFADLVIVFAFTGIIFFLQKWIPELITSNKVNVLINETNNSRWKIILFLVLIIPFLEELVYRIPLRVNYKYTILYLYLFTTGIVLLTFSFNFLNMLIIFSGISLLILLFYLFLNRKIIGATRFLYETRYRTIFYTMAILFCIAHIFNYSITIWTIVLFPILSIPQFFLALATGFLRISFGFFWGYFLHIIHNVVAFVLLPMLLVFLFNKEELAAEKEYHLTIEQCNEVINNPVMTITDNCIVFEGFSIKQIVNSMVPDEMHIIFSSIDTANILLNVNFTKKQNQPNSQKPAIIILNEIFRKFNLNWVQQLDTIETFDLEPDNNEILVKHVNCDDLSQYTNKVTYAKDHVIIENSDLSSLKKIIKSYYGINIRNSANSLIEPSKADLKKYNFLLPLITTDSLNYYLNSNYGLNLLTYKNETTYFFIKAKIHSKK